MRKAIATIGMLALALAALSPLAVREAGAYDHLRLAVAEGWAYGNADYWALVPVNERSSFQAGEKVQFFAQVGPIREAHQWRLRLYKDSVLFREVTNDRFYPDPYWGWNYSNFVPFMTDLSAGSYRVDYLLDAGAGYALLGSKSFTVVGNGLPYVFDHAVTSANWTYGTGDTYWDLKPVDVRSAFTAGERVWYMVQVRDVKVDHRYKVELYKDGNMLWDYTTGLNRVGSGWTFGNFYPYYDKAQPGSFVFKAYIDAGGGFVKLAETPFTVSGVVPDYVYSHTYIASGWAYGSGDAYWDLKPVEAKTEFAAGSKVYALAQVRNIVVNHQWKAELFRNGAKQWEYATPMNYVGGGWTYGNFYPYLENAQPGDYQFKVYLNAGSGYVLLDTKAFKVLGQTLDYVFQGATVAEGWTYGQGSEYWNIQPVNPRTEFAAGQNVFIVAQARNVYVDHRWKVELYSGGLKQWEYVTPLNNVGSGWAYSNFYPAWNNAQPGAYEFKVYLDSGKGFTLMAAKPFTVSAPVQKNIIQTAQAAGNFNTLLAAVEAAGLTQTLSGAGPFTLFAPTDAAFAKLPAGTVEALLADIPALTDILKYHVVGAKLDSGQVIAQTHIMTLNGQSVTVSQSDGQVYINNSLVITPDISAANGIIHVIDTVLIP